MENEIKLLKDNGEDKFDIEWINEFINFLQGEIPGSIILNESEKPKLIFEQAFNVIWYLQEHFPILPDKYEKCDECGFIYDSSGEGYYDENVGLHYCDNCRADECCDNCGNRYNTLTQGHFDEDTKELLCKNCEMERKVGGKS